MHPKRGPGVPIGQRPVTRRHDEPELPQPSSRAFLLLMGRPTPEQPDPQPAVAEPEPQWPLSLVEPHVLVDTDAGPSAGLLVELDRDRARARVFYAWDDKTGSQGLIEA